MFEAVESRIKLAELEEKILKFWKEKNTDKLYTIWSRNRLMDYHVWCEYLYFERDRKLINGERIK